LHIAVIVAAAVLLIGGYACLFKGMSESFQLQHEINARLPKERKLEPVFWSFGTWQRLRHLQKEVLPESRRPVRLRWFGLVGVVLLLS